MLDPKIIDECVKLLDDRRGKGWYAKIKRTGTILRGHSGKSMWRDKSSCKRIIRRTVEQTVRMTYNYYKKQWIIDRHTYSQGIHSYTPFYTFNDQAVCEQVYKELIEYILNNELEFVELK
jgi:hypothetical protein